MWSLEVTCMFGIFDLFMTLHPHIYRFLCTCLYPRIWHPHILMFVCTCLHPYNLTSSYLQVHMCELLSSHLCILISSALRVLACILASWHPHILRFMCACLCPGIFGSSYPQVYVCLLVSLHPDNLISSGSYVLASLLASLHLISTGSCVLACILASSVHMPLLVSSHL